MQPDRALAIRASRTALAMQVIVGLGSIGEGGGGWRGGSRATRPKDGEEGVDQYVCMIMISMQEEGKKVDL